VENTLKRFGYLLILAGALLVRPAAAFESGREFQELPFPPPVETGAKIEVREFFWYGCPHCYTFEPALKGWLKRRPANVEFIRTPGAAPHWLIHAQTYYAFEALEVLDKLHEPMFRAVQADPHALRDESSITAFVGKQGVDAARFRESFRSFGVRMKVERAKKLNGDYMISAVPLLVVDGKYVTGPSMAGGEEQAIKVLDHLIARAARERAATGKR
jgi:thiol:disulfide interchange protein DsbA